MDPDFLDRLRPIAGRIFPAHRILAAYAFESRVRGHTYLRESLGDFQLFARAIAERFRE